MSVNEASLRRLSLATPLDPAPIVALGFQALARRAVDDAVVHFADATRLDAQRADARVGAELVHYVRSGDRGPLHALLGAHPAVVAGLPPGIGRFLSRLASIPHPATGGPKSAPPTPSSAALRVLRGRDLGVRFRLQEIAGVPSPPPVGRSRELKEIAQAALNSPHLSIAIVGGYGVDLERVCDALLPAMASLPGGPQEAALAEIVGPFPAEEMRGPFQEFLDDLRLEREQGRFFFHRNLAELLSNLPVTTAAALLETGAFMSTAPKHVFDALLARAPGLALRLSVVRAEPFSRPDALAALTEGGDALAAWVGHAVPRELAQEVLTLADHYLPHVALPESAVLLLGDGVPLRGLTVHEPAVPAPNPPAASARLHATAVRAARIAPDALLARRDFSARDIADGLYDRVGSHRDACAFLGRTLAAACSAGGIKSKRDVPDAVLLFVGPAGVGKHMMARELATLLYGRDSFLSADLALHGGSPRGLFDVVAQDATPGMVDSFVRGRPFSVLYFANVNWAAPATLSHLRDVIETGRLGPGGTGTSLRRSIVALSIDGRREGNDLGFTTGPPPAADLAWVRDTFFSAAPGLLHSVTLVPIRPLEDREYVEVVRRRLGQVVVHRLATERDVHVRISERAIAHLASEVKTSKLGGERVEEVIEELVLAPLWKLLTEGVRQPALDYRAGKLGWRGKKPARARKGRA